MGDSTDLVIDLQAETREGSRCHCRRFFAWKRGKKTYWRGKQIKGDQEKSFKNGTNRINRIWIHVGLAPSCDSREATARHLISNIYQMAVMAPWTTSLKRAGASSAFLSFASDWQIQGWKQRNNSRTLARCNHAPLCSQFYVLPMENG